MEEYKSYYGSFKDSVFSKYGFIFILKLGYFSRSVFSLVSSLDLRGLFSQTIDESEKTRG